MGALQVRLLKGLDRMAGRWAYRALLRHDTRKTGEAGAPAGRAPEDVRKLLVIRPGGIGDAVLFYPMLGALRKAYPNARLDVLAERRNIGLLGTNDLVDRTYAYDRNFGGDLFTVLREGYDVVVDTEQYHFFSAVAAYLTRAPVRCGFDTQGRGGLFTHRVSYSDQLYEVHSFLNLVRSLTGREQHFDQEQPFLVVSERHLEWARDLLGGEHPGPVAIVSPGASMSQRRWAPERYRKLVSWLLEKGMKVAVIGGTTDVEVARTVSSGIDSDRFINVTGETTLARTAALIALADLYISSDTGPLHIAYGVGTPTVHLFGSGILEKWAPAGSRYRTITKALPCSPCTRYGYTPPCPYDVECMKRIEVEDVTLRVEELLGDRGGSPLVSIRGGQGGA